MKCFLNRDHVNECKTQEEVVVEILETLIIEKRVYLNEGKQWYVAKKLREYKQNHLDCYNIVNG